MKMKKSLMAGLVCLAALGLAACTGNQKATTSATSKTSSTSSQSSASFSSSSSSESSTTSQSSDSHQAYQSLLQELGQKPDYQTSQYAFYDINKDGTDELLIENSPAITEVFALQNNQPVSILTSIVALQGGARSSFSILTDGTIVQTSWQSTRPEATAVAYTLENGTLKEGKTVTYDMTSQVKPAEALGLSGQELDANSLSWQDFATTSTPSSDQAQPASTGMDINAIASGDFSSIAGTWQNGRGATMVFTQSGIDDSLNIEIAGLTVKGTSLVGGWHPRPDKDGISVGGGYLIMLPSNTTLDSGFGQDDSDKSRERMLMGNGFPTAEDFYYKVD